MLALAAAKWCELKTEKMVQSINVQNAISMYRNTILKRHGTSMQQQKEDHIPPQLKRLLQANLTKIKYSWQSV